MSEAAFSTSGLQLEADRGIWMMGPGAWDVCRRVVLCLKCMRSLRSNMRRPTGTIDFRISTWYSVMHAISLGNLYPGKQQVRSGGRHLRSYSSLTLIRSAVANHRLTHQAGDRLCEPGIAIHDQAMRIRAPAAWLLHPLCTHCPSRLHSVMLPSEIASCAQRSVPSSPKAHQRSH